MAEKKSALARLETQLAAVKTEREELAKEYHKMGNKLVRLHKKQQKIKDKIDEAQGRDDDLGWLLECSHDESSYHYEKRRRYFEDNYKSFISTSGFMQDTKQSIVRIAMYAKCPNDEDYTTVLRGLKEVLPHLKNIDMEIGSQKKVVRGKYIDIFEHTLSEYGIWSALVENSGVVKILRTTYGRTQIEHEFGNLEDFLKFVKKNLYYEETYDYRADE